MRSIILAALVLSLSACAELSHAGNVIAPSAHDWRAVVTESDRARLREWRSAFVDALRAARTSGHSAEIAREGDLLDPDAALGGPIPDGDYRCRVIKLGSKVSGMLDYVSYPAFSCRITQNG